MTRTVSVLREEVLQRTIKVLRSEIVRLEEDNKLQKEYIEFLEQEGYVE